MNQISPGRPRAKPRLGERAAPLLNLIKGKPVAAIFEITLLCNSACGYCDLPINQGRRELSRREIRRIFADLYRDGIRFLFIQGGEPLARAGLIDVLEDLAAIGFTMALVTNGTRLTPGFIARLAQLPISISVSLDSLERDTYRRIRGRDQLPRVLAGLELLEEFPGPKYLTCIVSEANRADALDVAAFARKIGFLPIFGAYHWDVKAYGKADAELIYARQDAMAVFENIWASGLVPKGYFREYLKDNLRWLAGKKLAGCDAGRYSIAIDASGNVAPCLAWRQSGNLRRQSLAEILASFDKAGIKACSNQSTCNLLCSRIVGAALRRPLNSFLGLACRLITSGARCPPACPPTDPRLLRPPVICGIGQWLWRGGRGRGKKPPGFPPRCQSQRPDR
jgi:MoaA/NifB/PqqE/SkfB family radical SAM enzyme